MANSLFSQFMSPKQSTTRNGFDLDSRHVFSSKVGILNTPYHLLTIPKGEYSINVNQLCRSKALTSAAFTRFNVNYEFYRVHLNDLWSNYNSWASQATDSSRQLPVHFGSVPYFSPKKLFCFLFPYLLWDYILDNMDKENNIFYLSYISPSNTIQHASLHILDDTLYDTHQHSGLYTFTCANTPFESLPWSIIRNLDMMGYGNFIPLFQNQFKRFCSAQGFAMDDEVEPTNLIVDAADFIAGIESGDPELIDTPMPMVDYHANLWIPLAYNKVFDNVYRNPFYDLKYSISSPEGTFDFDYVELFNVDDVDGDIIKDDFSGIPRLMAIFASKYHQYPRDIFTAVLPSTQYGDVSVLTDDRSWLNLDIKLTTPSGGEINSTAKVLQNNWTGTTDYPLAASLSQSITSETGRSAKFRFDPALAISVLNMRKAEALQRFNENRIRVGNRIKDIFESHFGVQPKSETSHLAYYLGSFDGSINLNVVTATSSGENTELGEQGATGVGVVDGKTIHYKTDDFDCVICIQYVSKPAEYDAYGCERPNQILDPWDLPYNELQNIGLAPVDLVTLNQFAVVKKDGSLNERSLGYLPRFIELKSDYDKVHGEFFSSVPTLDTIEARRFLTDNGLRGLFSNFVTPKRNVITPQDVDFMYIDPRSVDNVFRVLANSQQSTDQFDFNCLFSVKAVLPLSVIGLPY